MSNTRYRSIAALLALAASTLAGCAVAPAYPVYSSAPAEPYWVGAVPADHYEVVPASPHVGAIWIGGRWVDDRGHRAWRPGHWAPPQGGYYRAPRHRDGRGYEHRGHGDGRGYEHRGHGDGRGYEHRGHGDGRGYEHRGPGDGRGYEHRGHGDTRVAPPSAGQRPPHRRGDPARDYPSRGGDWRLDDDRGGRTGPRSDVGATPP